MANHIEPVIVAALRDLYRKGVGLREASRQMELARGTVQRHYKNFWRANVMNVPSCSCGRRMNHRGFCLARKERWKMFPPVPRNAGASNGLISSGT